MNIPFLRPKSKRTISRRGPSPSPQRQPSSRKKPPSAPLSRGSHSAPKDSVSYDPKSRIRFFNGLYMLAFIILTIRAVDLTIWQGEDLQRKAMNQHKKRITVPANRGRFLDRNHRTLAISLPVKALSVDIDQVKEPRRLAAQLAPLINEPEQHLVNRFLTASPGSFPVIKRKLPPEIIHRIQNLGNPALFFMPENQRFYTMGEITAHILGFVDFQGKGVEGLERALEKELHGKNGVRIISKDRLGRPMPMVRTVTFAKPGTHIALTIDTTIQYIAYRALLKGVLSCRATSGMVVIMNPTNGDILALVNQPSFNPNNLGKSEALSRRNHAVTDLYEPGSTFKVFTVAAALDLGIVKPTTVFDVEKGKFKVADRTIRDFHRDKSMLTVSQIIQTSSNVGAAKIGLKMGNRHLEDYIFRFGFGRPTGVELEHEPDGAIPDITSYRQVGLANRSYGYGITVTPLQLTTAITAAVNGGKLFSPHLVASVMRNDTWTPTPRSAPKQVITPETSRLLREMMIGVVSLEGTAAKAAIEGYVVGGKTGTARKASHSKGYVQGNYFSSFVGFVPATDPKLVIFVGIDEPKDKFYGGLVAAPVFQEIAQEVLPLLSVFPTVRSDPNLPPTKPKPQTDPDNIDNVSLAKALESLKKKGIIPLVNGAGSVTKQVDAKDGPPTLVLK